MAKCCMRNGGNNTFYIFTHSLLMASKAIPTRLCTCRFSKKLNCSNHSLLSDLARERNSALALDRV